MALSSSFIFELLQQALSQDENARKPAEDALTKLENTPGFCSCLLEIISTKQLDSQGSARWLASVYFKNSINRHWRNRRDSIGISNEEKPHVRAKLLELLCDENNQVAIQLAVLVSKIARIDFPKEWPELFPALLQKLNTDDFFTTQRIYLVLNQILKELSTKRLAVDQRNFASMTMQLFEHTWKHWMGDYQTIIQTISSLLTSSTDSFNDQMKQNFTFTCERWMLCLKCVKRMLLFGYPSDEKSCQEVSTIYQVIPPLLHTVQNFLQFSQSLNPDHFLLSFLQKSCLKIMKIIISVQEIHPYSFSKEEIIISILSFSYNQVNESQLSEDEFQEKFLIQCMIFLQHVINCPSYKTKNTSAVVVQGAGGQLSLEEMKKNLSHQSRITCDKFFDHHHVVNLCSVLIQRYFILKNSDIDEWESDGENFYNEENISNWKDRLRPCSQSLFLALFEHYSSLLCPVVMDLLKKGSENVSSMDASVLPSFLLFKEACYFAVGLANYDIQELIDFSSWYTNVLTSEISNKDRNFLFLRRRIAWLLGQFSNLVKGDLRKNIYFSLIELLQDSDKVVQLTVFSSFNYLIDDVNFLESEFMDILQPLLQLSFQYLQNMTMFESQLQIMNLISLVIERIGPNIIPYSTHIMHFIPTLWEKAESQNLLKIQILVILQKLISALGNNSSSLYEYIYPILNYTTNLSQPDVFNMLEDGIQLWYITLINCPVMTPQLLSIFPNLVSILESNFDHLPVAIRIMECYVLIGGLEFMQSYAPNLVHIFNNIIGNVNDMGLSLCLSVIETIIQCFPENTPALLESVLKKLMLMVFGLIPCSDSLKILSFSIFARIIMQSQDVSFLNIRFFNNPTFVAQWKQTLAENPQFVHLNLNPNSNLFYSFLDTAFNHFKSLSSSSKKKLCALSFCVLLTIEDSNILSFLPNIMEICLGVIQDPYLNGIENYAEEGYDDGALVENSETYYARKRQLSESDPVNVLHFKPFLGAKLQTCASIFGKEAFVKALSAVKPSTWLKIKHEINFAM